MRQHCFARGKRRLFISAVKHLLAQHATTFGNKDGISGALTDMGCLKLKTALMNWNTELEPTVGKYAVKRAFVRNFRMGEPSWLFQGR